MHTVIVIPALNPDEKLLRLGEQLHHFHMPVVIVDDGSKEETKWIFKELEARFGFDICTHAANKGKGAALRTGIRFAEVKYPDSTGFVTADADGQHAPLDIRRVAAGLERHPDSLVLGTRDFSQQDVPFRSFWGNRITSFVFWLSAGKRCGDTQTGLRGIPAVHSRQLLAVPGEKYEFEMNVLLEAARLGIPFQQVSIRTIYLDENASSHFHPVRDSLRIYMNILRYSVSSMISAAADLSLFTVFSLISGGRSALWLLAATVLARVMSGTLNFTLNKHWVFRSERRSSAEALRYGTLFVSQMLLSWLLVTGLSTAGVPLTLAKIFTDSTLFLASYQIQKRLIFSRRKGVAASDEKILYKAL